MNKQAPTGGRIAIMVLFALSCFGLLLYLWLSFGGPVPFKPKGYQVKVPFREATQLGELADVRVAGVPIGRVVDKEVPRDRPDVVLATLELDPEFAPLRSDARASLREKTLIGETFVELTLGSKRAAAVPDGGELDERLVNEKHQLEEILDTFDPYTQQAFRTWQRSLGSALNERGQDLNDVVGNLPGFVRSGGDLLEVLDRDRASLRGLVRNTGAVFEALTEDERQLGRLITGTEGTYSAIARRREDFADVWQIFPTFLMESRLTSRTLRRFAPEATPVVRDLAPATDDLALTLRALGKAAPDLRRFLRSLGPLAEASEEGLPASTELLRGVRPVLQSLEPYLGELNPTIGWIAEHSYTLTDMLSNLGIATAAKTTSRDPRGTGHYLRQFGPTGVESLGLFRNRVASNRGNTYINPLALASREQGRSGVTAAWDCGNDDGKGLLCRTDPPYTFQGQTRKYPHVQAESYRSGKPTVPTTALAAKPGG